MTRTLTLTGLLTLALLVTTSSAQAQVRRGVYPNTIGLQSYRNLNTVNPNYYIAPGMTLNQYAYNVSTLGRAYSYVPPYALGYNPYPAVVNYGPVYSTPYGSGYNPYAYNPYALAGSGYPPYYP